MLDLFTMPADPSLLSYGSYDARLVVLSVLVAIFTSWVGLRVAGQAAANRAQRAVVLSTGSVALGAGVWAMHFIGMLAFDLCTRVEYDPTITFLSNVPSVAASFVALSLIGRERIGRWTLLLGGVLVGAGIGAMHYTGMAGMRMSLNLRYDPAMFALSIVVAVVLATLALWVRFGLKSLGPRMSQQRRLLLSAVVMGCAIAGMHYTAMEAARFVGHPSGGSADTAFLALAISLITIAFTIFVLGANGLLRYRQLFLDLSRSEAWMRALLVTAVDGVITVDRDGTILEFNAAAERIFGWTRTEAVGRNVRMLVPHQEKSEADGLLRLMQTGDLSTIVQGNEVAGLRKDGSVVPIRRALGYAPLGDRDLIVAFVTDISERRAMEQAIKSSEQQFRSLIGNIPGISFRACLRHGHDLVYISDAVSRVTGFAAADFIGVAPRRRFEDLIHIDDRERVAAIVHAALEDDRPYLVEYRLQHADGSTRWLWENGTGVRDESGALQWRDGVVLDISERHRMEQDLRMAKERAEQAAAARATFLANMSHEIRTPMNSILGFTDVLLDGQLSEAQRRHLDTIRNAGRSLLRLLNEVLDTAKLDKGAVELEQRDYNLLSLADELSSTIGTAARAKGLRIEVNYDPELPASLRGDELRMRQVLTNLLDNAVKFTERGKVVLAARIDGGRLHIEVRDTGIGIAPDRLAAIFDPFTQADASMTRRFGGTGLGTTICKQLVELMGGTITAESTPGVGTTFHVRLPLVLAQGATAQTRARGAAELPPLSVLAADDVPQNLELLQLMMARRGHTVTTAPDGAQAVAMAARGDFDLILMDFQMPAMDGLEATRAIRQQAAANRARRVPVIAMTASVLPEHRRASLEAGMDGFASKPVDWIELSHEIARVLGLASGGAALAVPAGGAGMVLDREAGLRRWGSDADTYHGALAAFADKHVDLARDLSALSDTGDYRALAMLAHRARGSAANLGLERLSQTLAVLEQMANGPEPAAPASVLAALASEHAAALSACGKTAATSTAAAAPAARVALSLPRVRAAAVAVEQALRRGALDDGALSTLAAALGAHATDAPFAALQSALSDFDFELALNRLRELCAALGCDLSVEQAS
jgi:PAS domain S-box-containing protein